METERSVYTLKNDGNKLFKEGRYKEACDKYTEALKQDPSNAVIFSNRSATHTKLKNYGLALSDALECIKFNPQWPKGFFRKALALEGLGRYKEVMQSTSEGFRLSGEGRVKKELVMHWLTANQKLNRLPEGSIELPRGVLILSQDYLQVLTYLMQSLSGERPLSLELTEQCLYSCAEQIERLLIEFGEPVSPIIKEWVSHLPHEVYPYSINPIAKADLEQQMKSRSELFTRYLDKEVDPALFPLLRPILGLVVLIVLNRTNILTECNTGHHAAELMNRSLLPLFEDAILSMDEYYSMYVGRICAVLDSFVGRGYKLSAREVKTVQNYYAQLEKAVQSYPKSLPEYEKDRDLAKRALSNVQQNILLPPPLSPPSVPVGSTMSVEIAKQLVKEEPQLVKVYLEKHLQELLSIKFLTMGEVEELLTMTGIYVELKMNDEAFKVFKEGEQAFFQVLGHMLSSNTLMLDQCPATIAPIRQLVLSEASLLKDTGLFADVVLRWKCLFREFRSELIRLNSGDIFRLFFQWYMKHQTSTESNSDESMVQAAILQHMNEEQQLLQKSAKSTLLDIGNTTYKYLRKELADGIVTIDYIFYVPLRENPLLDAYCVISDSGKSPIVCELDYKAIRTQSEVLAKQLQSQSSTTQGKIDAELTLLGRVIFPPKLLEILSSGRVKHLYIGPDSDLVHIPFDSIPVDLGGSAPQICLFEKFSVSILSSMRQLLSLSGPEILPNSQEQLCSIIGNPNYDLCKPAANSSTVEKLITFLCGYFSISSTTEPTLEQLEHSQEEVDFVTSHLQSNGLTVQSIIGDEATLSKILSLKHPLLLHIASHACGCSGRSVTPYRGNFYDDLKSAAVALAGFNTFSRKQFDRVQPDCGPGQLPPLAIYSMNLQGTKLVFLSACSSAAGTAPIQEAADSLAEAFLTAGAETVIAALWPVGDKPATELSKLFYSKVTNPGIRPSEALKYAKNKLRELDGGVQTKNWLCYAAFTCYGLDKPLF